MAVTVRASLKRAWCPTSGERQAPVSRLSLAKQAEVIAHLCEGAGIRPTSRLENVSKPTILSLLLRVGRGCDRLHDRLVRDLDIRCIEGDEIWTFVHKKQARCTPEDDPTWGDAYTFLAQARSQKLIVSYRVGKRDAANTDAFVRDMRARLVTVPEFVTDAFGPYAAAVAAAFEAIDYGQVVKNYSRSPRRVRDGLATDYRYEPPRDPFITRTPIYGSPNVERLSTSHVERLNLDVRMSTRRLTRLCNGFSRKLTHLTAAMSLFVAHTNLVRIHGVLRVTPAMEAGIVDRVWSVEELVDRALAAADEPEAPPEKRPLRLPEMPAEVPAAPARALPNGRGFLRLVTAGGEPPRTPTPKRAPEAPEPAAEPSRQLDLFSWTPPKREPVQLSLFD
jgi:IS1 family transposase